MAQLTLQHEMPFGKFKGQQIEDLVEDEPGYVRWLCENTNVDFEDMVLEALERRERRK